MSRPTRPRSSLSGKIGLLALVFVLVLVNFPLVHSFWLRWQTERSGVDVTAQVVADRVVDGRSYVGFRLPERIDGETVPEDETGWTVQVDDEAYRAAVESGEIEVRVLPDRPSSYSVEGEVRGRGAWVSTLFVDVFVVAVGLLLWRLRRAMRPALVLRASEDLEPCEPGAALERVAGQEYVVRGEVEKVEDDRVVLLVEQRRVIVELDGHANPVAIGQSARAHGHMIG